MGMAGPGLWPRGPPGEAGNPGVTLSCCRRLSTLPTPQQSKGRAQLQSRFLFCSLPFLPLMVRIFFFSQNTQKRPEKKIYTIQIPTAPSLMNSVIIRSQFGPFLSKE